MSRQFSRLVEAAFLQPVGMQRHGQDGMEGSVFNVFYQFSAEPPGQGEFTSVFESVHQTVDREGIAKCGDSGIEARRMRQAAAAALAMRGRLGALRAARREWWQIGRAGGAERALAVSTAEQAARRQAGIEQGGSGDLPSFG